MKLYDLLLKTISKMPNGWGETVPVDLKNGWTAPSDGILHIIASGNNNVAYISRGKGNTYLAVYCWSGGSSSASACAKKGTTYKTEYLGQGVTVTALFTPFSYRGGYLYRLIKRLQSLFLKGVMA